MFFVNKLKTKVHLGFARNASDGTRFFPANDGWEPLSSAHRDIPLPQGRPRSRVTQHEGPTRNSSDVV